MTTLILNFSSYKVQLEKLAVLEKEKKQLKDRANSLEAQLVLKGRAVKEVEGMIEQVEQKHKEVGTVYFYYTYHHTYTYVYAYCVYNLILSHMYL
jgi:hypothetical protein